MKLYSKVFCTTCWPLLYSYTATRGMIFLLQAVLISIRALQGILLLLLEIQSVCLVLVMTPPFSTAASFPLPSHTHPRFSRFYQPHPIALQGFSPEDVFPGCMWFAPSLCGDFYADAASQKDDEIWRITWLTLNIPVAASHFFTAVYMFIGCVTHVACALVAGKF